MSTNHLHRALSARNRARAALHRLCEKIGEYEDNMA